MTKPMLSPHLHVDGVATGTLLAPISAKLAEMRATNPGALVGVAIGHCISRPDLPHAVSEYVCSFVSVGAGCSATALLLPRSGVRTVLKFSIPFELDTPVTSIFRSLLCPHPQLETVCASFMIAFHFPAAGSTAPEDIEVRIYTEPCSTLALAQRRAAEIRHVLDMLTDVHNTLGAYCIAPPEAEQLLAA